MKDTKSLPDHHRPRDRGKKKGFLLSTVLSSNLLTQNQPNQINQETKQDISLAYLVIDSKLKGKMKISRVQEVVNSNTGYKKALAIYEWMI